MKNLIGYVVRMLQDPVDKSPSSVRHCAVALVVAAIVVAIIGVIRGHEAAQTVTALSGTGAIQFFSRNKTTKDES